MSKRIIILIWVNLMLCLHLFLLWDFRDESAPQIHVRTWQPDQINGGKLPKDEVFSLSDFDI